MRDRGQGLVGWVSFRVPKFREIQCVPETGIILEQNAERKGCNSVVYRNVQFGKGWCLKCRQKFSEY